jgi:hypothetical protein
VGDFNTTLSGRLPGLALDYMNLGEFSIDLLYTISKELK